MNVATYALFIISFSVASWSVRVNEIDELEGLETEVEDGTQDSQPLQEMSGMDNLRKLIARQAKSQMHADNAGPRSLAKLSNHKIIFATVNTKEKNESHLLPGPPGWIWEIHNVAPQKPFSGNGDIVKYMKEFVADVPDDQLVVYMDGADVMYAGCDMEDFLKRFHLLSTATGAKVIFGAEYHCFHPPTAGCDNYPVRSREKVLNAAGVKAEDLDRWSKIDTGLKYLNGGFHMGKAKDLRRMYSEWYSHSAGKKLNQDGAAQTYEDYPDLVALDYASLLVSNLFMVRLEKDGKALFQLDGEKKQWRNTATGRSVCFFHGNGQEGRDTLNVMKEESERVLTAEK